MVYLFLRHPLNAVLQDSISASKNEEQQETIQTGGHNSRTQRNCYLRNLRMAVSKTGDRSGKCQSEILSRSREPQAF